MMIKLAAGIVLLGANCALAIPSGLAKSTVENEPFVANTIVFSKKFKNPIISVAVNQKLDVIMVSDRGGYLQALDMRGKELWHYHYSHWFPQKKQEIIGRMRGGKKTRNLNLGFAKVLLSDKLKRFVATLVSFTNDYGEYWAEDCLQFDISGKFLWEKSCGAYITFADDENFSIIHSQCLDDGNICGDSNILDIEGNVIFSNREELETDDGYIYTRHAIYSRNNAIVWRLNDGREFIYVGKGYCLILDKQAGPGAILAYYELSLRKMRWEIQLPASSKSDGIKAHIAFNHILVQLAGKTLVYSLDTGQLRASWMNGIRATQLMISPNAKYVFISGVTISGRAKAVFYDLDGKPLWVKTSSSANRGIYITTDFSGILVAEEKQIILYDNLKYVKVK